MKESIQNLEKERGKLVDRRSAISRTLSPLESYFKDKEIPDCIQESIQLLKKQHDEVEHELKGFSAAIEGFQKVCTHKNSDGSNAMSYSGHDSHKNYYTCRICGFEDGY